MKRYFSIISSLSVIWSLTSLFGCVKEVADKGQEASCPVVYLSSDKPQFSADEETKTQWTGETIVWSKGDKVQVAAKGDGAWLSADGSAGVSGALVESVPQIRIAPPQSSLCLHPFWKTLTSPGNFTPYIPHPA